MVVGAAREWDCAGDGRRRREARKVAYAMGEWTHGALGTAVVSHIPAVVRAGGLGVEGAGVVRHRWRCSAFGVAVGAGRIEQAGSGFVVAERIAFRVVQMRKAGAGGAQCGWSWCMSYTTLRRGGKERRALQKGARVEDGWGRPKVKQGYRARTILAIWKCSPSQPQRDTDSHLRRTGTARVLDNQVVGPEWLHDVEVTLRWEPMGTNTSGVLGLGGERKATRGMEGLTPAGIFLHGNPLGVLTKMRHGGESQGEMDVTSRHYRCLVLCKQANGITAEEAQAVAKKSLKEHTKHSAKDTSWKPPFLIKGAPAIKPATEGWDPRRRQSERAFIEHKKKYTNPRGAFDNGQQYWSQKTRHNIQRPGQKENQTLKSLLTLQKAEALHKYHILVPREP
ncbi:hypothetical protein B0H10DRAFT_1971108 [Mycena sp. CBHHK59/15]|nr:hypothetical protein B0H10DRAFT_1971108 [Mycena sp. CBHHK59/15]